MVFFKLSDAALYPDFMDNGPRLADFARKVSEAKGQRAWVVVSSGSSPDGSLLLNKNLTRDRSASVQAFLKDSLGLSASEFVIQNQPVRWEMLDKMLDVASSAATYKDAVREAMRLPEGQRAAAMKTIQNGKAWEDMKKNIFPAMRSTFVAIGYDAAPVQEEETVVVEDVTPEVTVPEEVPVPAAPVPAETAPVVPEPEVVAPVQLPAPEPVREARGYWVKTNLLGWALFQMNAAAEVELFNHVTFSFPVYYGSFDWFVNTIKFNTLEIRPEIRGWLRKDCTGPFVAIHGTLGMYNYALGGELRYQDHMGKTPTWGGGLTLGWRLPLHLFGSDRFGLEMAVGAAALKLNYDTFYNVKNGNYVDQGIQKMYYGIDNVSVSLTYRFDSKRRFRR